MISQYPAGLLADRLSRRSVLLVFSIMASALCLAMMLPITDLRLFGIPLVYVMSFLFGLTTFPIYSICAAHASDFVQNDRMISLSASLIFLYASGAIISPLIAGWIIEQFGAPMMFSLISAAHVALMLYTIYRNFSRPAETRRRYATSRTSLFIASILRPRRNNGTSARNRQPGSAARMIGMTVRRFDVFCTVMRCGIECRTYITLA